MSNFDKEPKKILRNLAIIGLLAFGLVSCAPQATTVPTANPSIVEATATSNIGTTDIIDPQNQVLLTPSIISTPTLEQIATSIPMQILSSSPPQWETGEDGAAIQKRMSDTIVGQISAEGDQYTLASESLPPNYMQAVVNITYDTDKPWGGTATCIGTNTETNESIFLTASHVMLADNTQFHLRQPHSNLDVQTSLDNIVIARSPEGYFNDLAVIKLPFIPTGIQPFAVSGTELCITQEPPENMAVRSFAFPYINGGPGFIEFFSQGGVELIGDTSIQTATCYNELASGSLYIPTTMPTRPGTSGALVLDGYDQGIGIMKAMSPHGAAVMPLDKTTLATLIAQTGFVPMP